MVVSLGGHLSNTPNKDLVYNKKPNHMGIYIGNVSNFKPNKGHIFFNLTDSISIGDTIGFENENTKYTVSELMIKGKNVTTANNKQLVEIGRMKGNINIGDRIYKLASKELTNIAKLSYSVENKKTLLSAFVKVKENEPIELTVSTIHSDNEIFDNITVHQKADIVAVKANSKPIDSERIKSQICKTSNTIFTFEDIKINLDDNLFIPSISVLNELRRNCLEEILNIFNSRIIRKGRNVKLDFDSRTNIQKHKHENLNITKSLNKTMTPINLDNSYCSAKDRNISLLLNIISKDIDYTLLKNVDNVYIPLKYFADKKLEKTLHSICNNFKAYIYLPTIIKANYKNILNNIITNSIDNFRIKGFVISNISSCILIKSLKEKYGDKFEYIANYTLNVYNNYTDKVLKSLGISKFTISPELNSSTINSICQYKITNNELIVYGRTPLMTSNYCLLGSTNKCYPTCGSRCKEDVKYYLKDRLGFSFRIIPDSIQTVTTIYNSKITSINGSDFNVNSYRIDVIDESIDEINDIVNVVLKGSRLEGKDYTNGNLNKEI